MVLDSGAMRGLFTAGVLDVMMENGIFVDGVVGVSAGACFGCNYKSGQIGRTVRYNLKYCRDPRYCSFASLIFTGDLYGADFCYHKLPFELDLFDLNAYRSSKTEFYVTCTDVDTGEAVYHKNESGDGEDLEWMRASASMPLVSRVVNVGGRRLVDGGVADSIPIKFFESIGYRKNIVILTQPDGYTKTENKLSELVSIRYRNSKKLKEAMKNRHNVYNSTTEYIKERERQGMALVIRPEAALSIGHIEKDPDKLSAVYAHGRATAEKMLDKIKEFVG